MDALARELAAVSEHVQAHKDEDVRRATEATAPRVEEVGSDMDMGGGTDTGEEFGVNFEAGKRRKVARQSRFSASEVSIDTGPDAIFCALQKLSETDKERCKNFFCMNLMLERELMKLLARPQNSEKVRLSLMHVQPRHLPNRTWLIRHVGRWRRPGTFLGTMIFLEARGCRKNSWDLSQRTKIKAAWKFSIFPFSRPVYEFDDLQPQV